MTNNTSQLLSTEDVADYLQIKKRQVYLLIKKGHIQSLRIGRLIRVSRNALDSFIQDASKRGGRL
jgi:excisionase family DNA binding protein